MLGDEGHHVHHAAAHRSRVAGSDGAVDQNVVTRRFEFLEIGEGAGRGDVMEGVEREWGHRTVKAQGLRLGGRGLGWVIGQDGRGHR